MAEIPSGTKFIGINPSVPTPENKSSQNNAFQEVYTIEDIQGAAGGYTETIVNIASSKILEMGDSPIELLPAAGVGKYYDIDKILIEFSAGSVDYSFETGDYLVVIGYGVFDAKLFEAGAIDFSFDPNGKEISPSSIAVGQFNLINTAITLSVSSEINPTLGNGTMRAKIYHKTVTFGA